MCLYFSAFRTHAIHSLWLTLLLTLAESRYRARRLLKMVLTNVGKPTHTELTRTLQTNGGASLITDMRS